MFPRAEIKEYAKAKFKAHYGNTLGVYIICMVLSSAVSGATFGLGALLLMPPLTIGLNFFAYLVYQGEKPDVGQIFSFGFDDFGRKLGGMLWSWLFTTLWTLLFIIPGIVKSIAYSMTPFLLAEYPNIPPTEAIKVSMKITDGRKGDIFIFYLSYIGWYLLAGITFCLTDIFYSGPYMQVAFGGVYDVLKKDALETGRITLADLGIDPQNQRYQTPPSPGYQTPPNQGPGNPQ